jgi:hypothetical protein
MKHSFNKPIFAKRIFWDVDFEKLDFRKKDAFVIERVFERGDVTDIRECRRYYGDNKIRTVLIRSKWLSLKTIYLACAVLGNKPSDYKCFNTVRLNQEHWNY